MQYYSAIGVSSTEVTGSSSAGVVSTLASASALASFDPPFFEAASVAADTASLLPTRVFSRTVVMMMYRSIDSNAFTSFSIGAISSGLTENFTHPKNAEVYRFGHLRCLLRNERTPFLFNQRL